MALTKQQSRIRWRELQDLALTWDPIGVAGAPEFPRDECDCVLGPVLGMLERGATDAELMDFIQAHLRDHFGLQPVTDRDAAFVTSVRAWFRERWSGEAT